MKNTLLLLLLFIHFGYSQTTTVNYTALNENISNPERGIYHHTETQSSNYSSLSVSQLENWRVNDNITLILRLFYLKDFINTPIPQSYLNNMQADFDKMRQAGVKCIVRFAYSNNTNGAYDANKAQMLTHINQVSPYLKNNSDVISVVREDDKVILIHEDNSQSVYDKVIFAMHAPDALNLIDEPSVDELRILSCFEYKENKAVLHNDKKALYPDKKVYAAWNYKTNGKDKNVTLSYWINRLQNLNTKKEQLIKK